MVTQEQISAAARVLSDRSADACNIDRDDNWNMYADEFIEDATAALEAAQAQAAVEPVDLFGLLRDFQELNMGNFTDDDVSILNEWAIRAHHALSANSVVSTPPDTQAATSEKTT